LSHNHNHHTPQRTRAATYVSPPRPILPKAIADAPQAAQKRTAEQIEGIEEREEILKVKAKAKSATTKAATDDPRALSLEEQAKAETVLNDFKRYEIERIERIKKYRYYRRIFERHYRVNQVNFKKN
jgi:hypothetical protein